MRILGFRIFSCGWGSLSLRCPLGVVRLIRHLRQHRIVRVRVRCLVTCLTRRQIIRLGRTRLRAATYLSRFRRQFTKGPLLTIIYFRLFRGIVNALRSTFKRAHRFNCVGARKIFTTATLRFTRRSSFIVCLLRQGIMILGALRTFLRLIRLVMIHNGRNTYLHL